MKDNRSENSGAECIFHGYLEAYREGYRRDGFRLGLRYLVSDIYWDIYWPLRKTAIYVGDFFSPGYRKAKHDQEDEIWRRWADLTSLDRTDMRGEVAAQRLDKHLRQHMKETGEDESEEEWIRRVVSEAMQDSDKPAPKEKNNY